MGLRLGSRVFAPGWTATLATLLLLPALVSLGLWQWQRAEYKRALMAQAAAGKAQTVSLNDVKAADLARYQHVSAQGRYDSARQILLDNMPSQSGRPGYRVLTPLRLPQGAWVLVDRGWLPLGESRSQLPPIAVGEELRTVQGTLDDLPRPGLRLGAPVQQPASWPAVLNYPRYEELRSLYGETLSPRIVLLDEQAPDGFERRRQIDVGLGPERHLGYAVQWFGLALTLLVIYVVVNLKRVEKS